jgi:septation ring formation regulator EzrA
MRNAVETAKKELADEKKKAAEALKGLVGETQRIQTVSNVQKKNKKRQREFEERLRVYEEEKQRLTELLTERAQQRDETEAELARVKEEV